MRRLKRAWLRFLDGEYHITEAPMEDDVLYSTQPKEAAMAATRYVQHKSGQGEKWAVDSEYETYWVAYKPGDNPRMGPCYCLPKSEYVPVEPVKEWKDVTAQCEFRLNHYATAWDLFHDGMPVGPKDGYRIRRLGHIGTSFAVEHLKEVGG